MKCFQIASYSEAASWNAHIINIILWQMTELTAARKLRNSRTTYCEKDWPYNGMFSQSMARIDLPHAVVMVKFY